MTRGQKRRNMHSNRTWPGHGGRNKGKERTADSNYTVESLFNQYSSFAKYMKKNDYRGRKRN